VAAEFALDLPPATPDEQDDESADERDDDGAEDGPPDGEQLALFWPLIAFRSGRRWKSREGCGYAAAWPHGSG
jgi:hypothetical protein